MKYLTVLAILSVALLASAAPCHDKHEDNSNYEDNSDSSNKEINQSIGNVGTNSKSGGLVSTLLLLL